MYSDMRLIWAENSSGVWADGVPKVLKLPTCLPKTMFIRGMVVPAPMLAMAAVAIRTKSHFVA